MSDRFFHSRKIHKFAKLEKKKKKTPASTKFTVIPFKIRIQRIRYAVKICMEDFTEGNSRQSKTKPHKLARLILSINDYPKELSLITYYVEGSSC